MVLTVNSFIYSLHFKYTYIHLYMQLDIALWCKNQIEHSIWVESLLFSNCARSLEYSSSSTLAGLSYHICGKLEVAFKASPSSQHQHCTDEAQKAETVLSAVIYTFIYFTRSFDVSSFFLAEILQSFKNINKHSISST